MAADTSTFATVLQENFVAGVRKQYNDDYPLLKYIRQDSDSVDAQGEKATMLMQLGLNESVGFLDENGDVPQAGHPTYQRHEVTLRQVASRARITYRLMRQARSTVHSWVPAAAAEMQATRDAFTLTANQYLHGDGTGLMCRVKSTTVGVDNKMKLEKKYGLTNGGAPRNIIRRNQVAHILDTATYTDGVSNDRGKGTILSVNEYTGTDGEIEVTFAAGHTFTGVAANDYVFLQNTIQGWTDPGASRDNRPYMGMLGFFSSTSTLQNVAPATVPEWKARGFTASSANAIRKFRQAVNYVADQVRDGRIAYILSHREAHENFASLFDAKFEFRNVNKIDGYWTVAMYDGRPWFFDHTAPVDRAYIFPVGNTMRRFAVDDFINLVDEGGGPMHLVPNKLVFDQYLTAICEYGIERRNSLSWVDGLVGY